MLFVTKKKPQQPPSKLLVQFFLYLTFWFFVLVTFFMKKGMIEKVGDRKLMDGHIQLIHCWFLLIALLSPILENSDISHSFVLPCPS